MTRLVTRLVLLVLESKKPAKRSVNPGQADRGARREAAGAGAGGVGGGREGVLVCWGVRVVCLSGCEIVALYYA